MFLQTVDINIAYLEYRFQTLFETGVTPLIVRSPGRVNLIGEHTDYNEGFVLPAAVDKAIYFAVTPRTDMKIRIYSLDMTEWYEGTINDVTPSPLRWPNYLIGIVDQLQKEGCPIGGFNCMFGGDIPIGAGLSSSAAIECGLIFALNEIFRLHLGKLQMVQAAQRAENDFVGVQCGIMDQFVNIFGKDKTVLKIDCRSLEYELIPFERTNLNIVLCETPKRRDLASSEYNVRRQQCEEGVRILSSLDNRIRSLRDVDCELLENAKARLSPVVFQRCLFVVKENMRVLQACEDLRKGDFAALGRRMFESHEGLSKDYEVSSPGLDILVEGAARCTGVLGARMMGAGFGGCTINLVEEDAVKNFSEMICNHYLKETEEKVIVHIAKLKTGTERIN